MWGTQGRGAEERANSKADSGARQTGPWDWWEREGEQGDIRTPQRSQRRISGEGLLQNLGLCFSNCIMGDKFMAKLLSYEGYHRYISVTGGAWGKKVWRVRVGAEY